MTWANSIIAALSNPAIVSTVVMLAELAMRMAPTAKAWSLLVPVQYAFVSVANILKSASDNILTPMINAGNNIPPVNTAKK